jgi:proline racemase
MRTGRTRLLTAIDSHTAGHPTRVVTGGLPVLRGDSVAAKRDHFAQHHDRLRTFLLHEPRGHAAMVGVVPCESRRADFGAFFLASFTYLDMCGHATIGLAVTLDAMGLIAPDSDGHTRFTLEVPAGVVTVHVRYRHDRIVAVGFDNLPARLAVRDVPLRGPGGQPEIGVDGGPLLADIAYGGNWYGLVHAGSAGLRLAPDGTAAALPLGARLKQGLNRRIAAGEFPGLSEPLDSILFWEADSDPDGTPVSRHLVVIGPIKFDRSPCGTGTSARLAQMLSRGWLAAGATVRARNVLGVDFTASAQPLGVEPSGVFSVQPQVWGTAHLTGHHTFVCTPDDPLPDGFLCT